MRGLSKLAVLLSRCFVCIWLLATNPALYAEMAQTQQVTEYAPYLICGENIVVFSIFTEESATHERTNVGYVVAFRETRVSRTPGSFPSVALEPVALTFFDLSHEKLPSGKGASFAMGKSAKFEVYVDFYHPSKSYYRDLRKGMDPKPIYRVGIVFAGASGFTVGN